MCACTSFFALERPPLTHPLCLGAPFPTHPPLRDRELSDNDEGFASGSDEEEHDFVTDDDDESEEMPSRRSRRETGRERRAVSYREESDDDVDEDDNGGSESKGDDGLVDGEGTSPTRPTKKAGGKLGDR